MAPEANKGCHRCMQAILLTCMHRWVCKWAKYLHVPCWAPAACQHSGIRVQGLGCGVQVQDLLERAAQQEEDNEHAGLFTAMQQRHELDIARRTLQVCTTFMC